MLLVVDANVVLSSLISGGLADLILSPKLEPIAPERMFIEIRRHKAEALSKSKLSEIDFEVLLALLESKIRLIPMGEFIGLLPRAEELLGEHKKDAPYVALALNFNCPFWSYEKRFEKIGDVELLTTRDVRLKLSNI
ncbi:MAG: hypothetical protein KJ561_08275 [Nanoarchaeota archaeon]|nr:hypothetical protein [Nanoarchaeota archaeon]